MHKKRAHVSQQRTQSEHRYFRLRNLKYLWSEELHGRQVSHGQRRDGGRGAVKKCNFIFTIFTLKIHSMCTTQSTDMKSGM